MNSLIKLTILIITPFLIGLLMPEKQDTGIDYIKEGELYMFNPDHLDGPFTGGFGELTCHSCHFDYDLNMLDRGSLKLKGIGDQSKYKPGETYELSVTIQSDHLENGGFQMTTRFEDGTQAGDFEWQSDRLTVTPNIDNDIRYLQHSREGTSPTSERTVMWNFHWIAPETGDAPIYIHIAANAGNDDDSAFGDWVYTKELVLQPIND